MTNNIWFTADLHLGHGIAARERGFDSVEAHDFWIMHQIKKLGSAYRGAQLFVLGDFAFNDWKARIWEFDIDGIDVHLILGNHDRAHPMHNNGRSHLSYLMQVFKSVQTFDRIRGFALSHFPYDGDHTDEERHEKWRLRDGGTPLLHGHTHSSEKISFSKAGTPQIHVGIDAWGRPVSLHEVQQLLAEHTQKEN